MERMENTSRRTGTVALYLAGAVALLALVSGASVHGQTATTTPTAATTTIINASLFASIDTPDSAPLVACGLYRPTSEIPPGYGSPFDVVFSPSTLLLNVGCNKTNVGIVAGSGQPNQYVYRQGYVFAHGTWLPISLSGAAADSRDSGTWWRGQASGSTYIGEQEMRRLRWVVAYVCSYDTIAATWKCGCKDAACSSSGWQIQLFAHY